MTHRTDDQKERELPVATFTGEIVSEEVGDNGKGGIRHTPHTPSSDWEGDFIEKGADIEHTRWSNWQEYFFSACEIQDEDAEIVVMRLPKEKYDRWMRQIATLYAELSESEKESDRREVRSYLPLIRTEIAKARREERESSVEKVAEAIYNEMSYYEDGVKPKWLQGGNSLKQDEARRKALQALTNKES